VESLAQHALVIHYISRTVTYCANYVAINALHAPPVLIIAIVATQIEFRALRAPVSPNITMTDRHPVYAANILAARAHL
jgi:hypothetical protein